MSDEHGPKGDEPERKDQPLPGSVSDQNAEEAEPGHGGGEHTRRKGGEGGDGSEGAEGSKGAQGGDPDSGGEAGEGSQSTGHPDSAG
jgi:hypothetical protein